VNLLADYRMGRIIGYMGLSDRAARIFWSALMAQWMRLVVKIGGGPRAENTMQLYSSRLSLAIEKYTRDGDISFLEALYEDIAGVD